MAAMERMLDMGADYRRAFARLDAPAKYRSLKADLLKYIAADHAVAGMMKVAFDKGDMNAFWNAYESFDRKGATKVDRRLDEAGVTECGLTGGLRYRPCLFPPPPPASAPRLKRSWTANDSKSISPRPMGAASCFPGGMTAPPAGRSAVI